jgi:hypothetical protein
MHRMDNLGIKLDGDLQAFDFSSMCTSLQHAEIKNLFDEYIDMVFEYECNANPNNTCIHLQKSSKGEWTNSSELHKPSPAHQFCDKATLKEWIHFLVDDLFIDVGKTLHRQTEGLPMGTNCAGDIANLLCFMKEYKYMKSIATVAKIKHVGSRNWITLQQLSFDTRYIDDLLNMCVPPKQFVAITKKIYGSTLDLNLEQQGPQVNYLDMAIWFCTDSNIMASKLYEKHIELVKKGFKLSKFLHTDSCLSERSKYGIITGELSRFKLQHPLRSTFSKLQHNCTSHSLRKSTKHR